MTPSTLFPRPEPETSAFFFDFDGTLAPLAPTPESVEVSPRVCDLLAALGQRSSGALAIVSGRPIAGIDQFLAPLRLAAAGSHGAERRAASGEWLLGSDDDPRWREIEQRLLPTVAAHPGLLLEPKRAGLALHFRQAPQLEPLAHQMMRDALVPYGDAYVLQPGKMVFEIKPAGVDKGAAIAAFLEEAPFEGRMPVFLGDDLTDEKGFAVVNRLGGLSIKVGPGPSIANARLPDVEAVLDWLENVLGVPGS